MSSLARILGRSLSTLWHRAPAPIKLAAIALRETLYTVTVTGVILDRGGRVLLVQHAFASLTSTRADGTVVRGKWQLPGGFVARREQPDTAIRREVREEAGIELASVELAFVHALVRTARIEIVFLGRCEVAAEEVVPDAFEIREARWVPLADLPPDLHPDQREMIFRALARGSAAAAGARPPNDDDAPGALG